MNLQHLSLGKFPEEINVVIEIPQGSSIKYELDKKSGAVMVDRFLSTAMYYPFNYGFVPHTLSEDGDPVDVLVLSAQPIAPGCVIPSRVVGMLEMEDEAGIDTKILAVPGLKIDRTYAGIQDIKDIDELTLEKISHFFAHYKDLEKGKWVKVKNFLGKKEALASIKKAIQK